MNRRELLGSAIATTLWVREVAALSAKWEIDLWDLKRAIDNRQHSVEGLFGGVPVHVPELGKSLD